MAINVVKCLMLIKSFVFVFVFVQHIFTYCISYSPYKISNVNSVISTLLVSYLYIIYISYHTLVYTHTKSNKYLRCLIKFCNFDI